MESVQAGFSHCSTLVWRIAAFCVTNFLDATHISMREKEESELPPAKATASTEPAAPFADLALTAPILAGKLSRLPPEQLALIFPRMNSVGPL